MTGGQLVGERTHFVAPVEDADSCATAKLLEPSARLGPYEILARVGAGAMGDVYRARDTRLDRTIAVKVAKEAHRST